MRWFALSVLAVLLIGASPLRAAGDPEWPCVQRLVPELSPAMMWAGPPLDEARESWQAEPAISELAPEIAARRVPVEDAQAKVAEFASSLDPTRRERTLTLLFAGAFELIDRERRQIIAGIKRFSQAQLQLAERIRAANAALRQQAGGSGASAVMQRQAIQERRDWEIRLFDERQGSLTYLCEQPVLLEQRAFALARAIGNELK